VFACEAYTWDRPVRSHLDYGILRQHVADLDTSRLILTHLGPGPLACADDAVYQVAHDGLTLRL
jgi:hypothetical protein